MLPPGYASTVLLQEGKKAVLYRGIRSGDRVPVILKALHPECCTADHIEQLQHEYTIVQQINSTAIVNAYAFEQHQGIPYLVLEDFGGQSLNQMKDQFQSGVAFLKLAIQLTTALTQIHRSNVIHKDIKPDNIIVNLATHQVKIGDFGIAAFIPDGQQLISSSSRIQGSLGYLSPEQTGRMNRGIDSRSDLYSLGITFYELLTGQLPFQGNDPLEWVHCHIARSPTPPIERNPTIPQLLSDIVLKLLSKVPEDRYQSASGLQFDLEQCLEALEATGQISPFALGEQDISERLQIPQKLYGRDREIAQLLNAFDRLIKQGTTELVLVSGYAGIGKSALVSELHKPIVRERGTFISGKFDQYKRDIPYATLVQAFQTLARQILTEPEAKLLLWKQRIQRAIGNNSRLITDVIPEVEWIIGEQPPVSELGPAEAQNRFNRVFQNFVSAFAQLDSPLAIFLDDMQWADSATLNFIQSLLTSSSQPYLYFILAYRDNEVDLSHPFQLMLDKLRQNGITPTEIVLAPLSPIYVNQLISETLRCLPQRSEPLAQLVWQKTDGNPFFATEFLKTLYQENLLKFSHTQLHWDWSLAQIEAQGMTDNIVTLMLGRMQKLPNATQQVLKLASCFGNRFDLSVLSTIHEKSSEATAQDLRDAILTGLIVSIDNTEAKSYRFRHDRIQQAAYSLIPDHEKQAVHLKIGRLLLHDTPPTHLEEALFDIVNQLNIGIALIDDRTEQETLIRLNLAAAQKAKAAIAYTPALKYLNAASRLISGNAWETAYSQTFTLFRERAECEYLTGNLEAADALFQVLLQNAQSALDRADIYRLQLRLYQIAGKYEESLNLGLEALKLFDVTFPETEAQVQEAAAAIREQIDSYLNNRSIFDLVNAPILQDPTLRTVINLLTTASPPAYLSRPNLFSLLVLTAVQYSLQYGNTEDSCFAYSMYAMLLVSVFRDIPSGVAFSEMTIQLNQKLNDLTIRGTVLHIHGSHINVWCNHMVTDLPFLEQGFLGCVEAGDVTMANYNGYQGSWQMIEAIFPLSDAHQAMQKYATFARQSRHEATYQTIRLQQQFVMNWRGLTHHSLTLSDDEFDEAEALSILTKAGFSRGCYALLLDWGYE
jgi:predicted ATPase